MKKLICLLLVLTMLAGMTVFASAEDTGAKFVVSSAEAAPGETVEITISLENNPGVASMELMVKYDEDALTWTGIAAGEYGGTFQKPKMVDKHYSSGDSITWYGDGDDEDGDDFPDNNVMNDVFATLTFEVKEDAPLGTKIEVAVDYDPDNVYNWDQENVYFAKESGYVTIPGGAEPLADGFYLLVGNDGWTVDKIKAEQKFEENSNAQGEYLLNTTLAVEDQIKVVRVENNEITGWWPDGPDTQYHVDAAHSGDVTIYFKTDYQSGWSEFGGYFYIGAQIKPVGAETYACSLNLRGDIVLNFYVIFPDELLKDEGLYVVLKDTEYPVSAAPTRTSGDITVRQFSVAMNAKEMNDKVTLRVYSGEGKMVPLYRHSDGEDLSETGFEYTVQDYIQRTLAKEGAEESLKALMRAMSDYGSLAQAHFEYNTDNRAEVGDLSSVTAASTAKYANEVSGAAKGLSFKGTTLMLESTTAIRLYFTVQEGTIEDFTFKLGSGTVTPVAKDGDYYIEIPNIAAMNLDKTYTVTATASDGTVLTVKSCGLSYAYSVLSGADNPEHPYLKDLAKAIVLYCEMSHGYFG